MRTQISKEMYEIEIRHEVDELKKYETDIDFDVAAKKEKEILTV